MKAAFDIGLIELEPNVGNTPQIEAPTLAEVRRQIYRRPLWQTRDALPLEVDSETYRRARDEMVAIQQSRGWPLATACIERENFMLCGVPIVMGDNG